MPLQIFKELDITKVTQNQNATIKVLNSHIRVSTSQTTSTPGCIFLDSKLPKGSFVFSSNAEADTQNRAFLCVWVNGKKVGRSSYFTSNHSEQAVAFELDKESSVKFALLIHSVTKGQTVNVNISSANIHIREDVTEDVTEANNVVALDKNIQDTLYVYSRSSKFGHGSFIRNLSNHYSIEVIDSRESAIAKNKENRHIIFNGFTTEIESIVSHLENKESVHVIWHSMFKGSELMGENSRLHNLLRYKLSNPINCYLVSPTETLPNGWKRFPLPISVDDNSKFNTTHSVDIALPLGSPHSDVCKNLSETAIKALTLDCSCIATKQVCESLNLKLLSEAFAPNTESKFIEYEGEHQPIDPSYFQSSAIYVLPSISDSMPYTVVESINAGVPVLMSNSVGWANVFTSSSHVPKFIFDRTEDILVQAKTLATNLHARKALWAYQKRILLEVMDSRKRLLNISIPFVQQKQIVEEKTLVLDIAENLERGLKDIEDNKECTHLVGLKVVCNSERNRVCVLVELSNVATESSLDIKQTLRSQEFKNYAQKKDYWHILNTIVPMVENLNVEVSEELSKPFELLVIDQFGWAFNNIANEIIKYKQDDTQTFKITIPEMVVLHKLGSDCLENASVAVAFWYFTTQQIKQLCPKAKIITALYDHYSWKVHPQEMMKSFGSSDAIAFGNAKLKSQVTQFCKENDFSISNIKTYVLKDGVCPSKFSMFDKPRTDRAFTFGWIGKATQATDFDSSVVDLKGVSIINEAFQDLKSEFKDDVELHLYNANVEPTLPHTEVRDSFYSKIDCLICASESEGTPNTTFEALACGIPILSTDVGNVSDVMIEGINGYYFERDSKSLVSAMKAMLNTAWDSDIISKSVSEFHWEKKAQVWNLAINSLKSEK